MTVLRIRLRAAIRSRWRAWLAIGLLAGLLGGLVIAGAAGARRTRGSYARYLASINGADVYVDPFVSEQGDTLALDQVARLPQVARSERAVQLAVLVRSRAGRPIFSLGPSSIGWVLPTDDRPLDTIDRLKVLDGRLPDPRNPTEVIGDSKALSILGVRVGDPVALRTITQHRLDSERIHLYSNPRTAETGPLVRLHVVGVAANARADVDGGQMHLTPAFFHTYGERRIGAFIEEMVIKLRHGEGQLPAFKRSLAKVAGDRPYLLFEPTAGHPKIQHSIDLEARALWIITALGAIGAVLLVGQALLRLSADESSDEPALRALGADAGDQMRFAVARSALIAAPAVVSAAAVALAGSALMPIGWARELEPDSGLQFDASTILPGLGVLLLAIVAFGLLGAVRAIVAGADRRPAVAAETPLTTRLLRHHGSPAFTAGIRMALGQGPGRQSARGSVAAGVIAVCVCVTALTFAASFHHLTTTPRLYGQTWNYEGGFGQPLPAKTVATILRDRGVVGAGVGTDGTIAVNGVDTGVRAWDEPKGELDPEITAGRPPRALREIALASKSLDAAHGELGGWVRVRAANRTESLRVVGRVVLPSSKFNKLGYGAVMTFAALKHLDRSVQPALVIVRLAGGSAGAAAAHRLDSIFDANVVIQPDEVGDFGRVDHMPLYIALLATAAAAAALAHALLTRVRRSRRDLAVLKTLGFTRMQVGATVAWQATAIVGLAAVLGLPLGLLVGRFTWHLFATDLGVTPEVVVPAIPVVLVLPAVVVLGNLLASVPGALAARIKPAPALRTE